jgi:hypothetical protein
VPGGTGEGLRGRGCGTSGHARYLT